jgi:hypothetical protein
MRNELSIATETDASIEVIEMPSITEEIQVPNAVVVDAPKRRTTKITKPVAKVIRTRAPRVTVPVNELGVVDQIAVAFATNNLFATICGFVLGGIVPVTVFRTAHYSVAENPWLWVLVVGGLIYSAITVFKWGSVAFSSPVKSFGFVVLLEGTLTFSTDHYLAFAALGTLTAINGIATATNLIANRKEARKAK